MAAPILSNEKDVKREVKKLLAKHGWFFWMPPANGYGRGGISDFNAIKDGTFMAVETKFGSNKPSALQLGYMESIRAEKGVAHVVSDKNLEWFAAWLQTFDALITKIVAGDKDLKDLEIEIINAQAEMLL